MKKLIKRYASIVARAAVRMGLIRNEIIIRMDGGICSQMHFFIIGELLRKQGNSVRYDLAWYKTSGVDLDGRFCRNFDILRLFPKLKLEEERSNLIRHIYISLLYKRLDYFKEDSRPKVWQELKSPLYLDGYFNDSDDMFGSVFTDTFKIDSSVLDQDNQEILAEIEKDGVDSCSIHVRRGDLAKYNPAYGEPAEIEYFVKAVEYIHNKTAGNAKYYLFSDEPEWCRRSLLPLLGEKKIYICDINGSDKGYCDLALMSHCSHHITSHGSMGKYAALLRQKTHREGIVILPPNKNSREWTGRFTNTCILK